MGAAAGEKTKALLVASLGFSILSSSLSLLTLSIVGYKEYREEQGLVYAVGLPALIMFIVTTISAISSGIRVCRRSQPAELITNNGPPSTPTPPHVRKQTHRLSKEVSENASHP